MDPGEEKKPGAAVEGGDDLYAVLGLKKECSDAELRDAYKKLAMRWHPDRCTASGNSKCIEEAKEKFQKIQGAYSVLSDSNKRFLYDVGVYDSDDDDENQKGMGDFLGEMAQMMSQINPTDNVNESFEDLQQLFVDMFQSDLNSGFCGSQSSETHSNSSSFSSSFSFEFCDNNINGGVNGNNKRGNLEMNKEKPGFEMPGSSAGSFCFGMNDSGQKGRSNGMKRNGRKTRV
ncbi:hypothetical protein LUZ60_001143 [Juncus effusus]|nr:hypothetical protein LUZ60_001143 [Juncus effusus]